MAYCDKFANNFAGKINHIHAELDSGLVIKTLEVQNGTSGPILWDPFLHVSPGDVDRIHEDLRPIMFRLYKRCASDPLLGGFV